MKDLLEPLHTMKGILGGAIFTADGVVVASTLDDVDVEVVAALISQFIRHVQEGAHNIGYTTIQRITMRAVYGKLFILHLGEALLLVAAKRATPTQEIWLRMEEVVQKVPKMSESTTS